MNREEIVEASKISDCDMDCGYCMFNCENRADAISGTYSIKNVKCPFELGAEWMQEQKQAEIDAIKAQVNEDTYELAYQDAIDNAYCWLENHTMVDAQLFKEAMKTFKQTIKENKQLSNLNWLNANYDKVLLGDGSLVNMEIDKLKEENEQLHNKVSELTEQLDASHIFCEGVKGAVVKKAAKWIKDHIHCYFQVWYDKMELAVHSDECATDFIKAMKGE